MLWGTFFYAVSCPARGCGGHVARAHHLTLTHTKEHTTSNHTQQAAHSFSCGKENVGKHSRMTELKPVSKAVLADASELHEERGECDLTQLQACLLIATAALSRAESIDGIDDDTRRNVKRARKLIGEYLPSAEVNDTAERKGLDLGQYAHTKVFDGNAKRVEKFARLMGGAASTGANDAGHPAHHNTFAPDSKTTKRIAHEIEDQFNAAVQHKGKKGLGS